MLNNLFLSFDDTMSFLCPNDHSNNVSLFVGLMEQLRLFIAISMMLDRICKDLEVFLKMKIMCFKIFVLAQKNVSLSFSSFDEFWFVVNNNTQ